MEARIAARHKKDHVLPHHAQTGMRSASPLVKKLKSSCSITSSLGTPRGPKSPRGSAPAKPAGKRAGRSSNSLSSTSSSLNPAAAGRTANTKARGAQKTKASTWTAAALASHSASYTRTASTKHPQKSPRALRSGAAPVPPLRMSSRTPDTYDRKPSRLGHAHTPRPFHASRSYTALGGTEPSSARRSPSALSARGRSSSRDSIRSWRGSSGGGGGGGGYGLKKRPVSRPAIDRDLSLEFASAAAGERRSPQRQFTSTKRTARESETLQYLQQLHRPSNLFSGVGAVLPPAAGGGWAGKQRAAKPTAPAVLPPNGGLRPREDAGRHQFFSNAPRQHPHHHQPAAGRSTPPVVLAGGDEGSRRFAVGHRVSVKCGLERVKEIFRDVDCEWSDSRERYIGCPGYVVSLTRDGAYATIDFDPAEVVTHNTHETAVPWPVAAIEDEADSPVRSQRRLPHS
ncbi:hypothetical protein DIPPA_00493 [Diplonema papillatum]|nr:hypothetical protein DIPPA_00493 [Diplonema papillatum]